MSLSEYKSIPSDRNMGSISKKQKRKRYLSFNDNSNPCLVWSVYADKVANEVVENNSPGQRLSVRGAELADF